MTIRFFLVGLPRRTVVLVINCKSLVVNRMNLSLMIVSLEVFLTELLLLGVRFAGLVSEKEFCKMFAF